MDGRGRWLDNVFIERLWRSVKYEEVYWKGYQNIPRSSAGAGRLLRLTTTQACRHQGLESRTPGRGLLVYTTKCKNRQPDEQTLTQETVLAVQLNAATSLRGKPQAVDN
jgi:putative transposase